VTPYVRAVLEKLRDLPTAAGRVRPADQRLAEQLESQGTPLALVQGALHLAALRRMLRPPGAPPLPPIRSLAYVRPILDELSNPRVDPGYLEHLEHRLAREIRRSRH